MIIMIRSSAQSYDFLRHWSFGLPSLERLWPRKISRLSSPKQKKTYRGIVKKNMKFLSDRMHVIIWNFRRSSLLFSSRATQNFTSNPFHFTFLFCKDDERHKKIKFVIWPFTPFCCWEALLVNRIYLIKSRKHSVDIKVKWGWWSW